MGLADGAAWEAENPPSPREVEDRKKRERYEKAALRRASCRADLVIAERAAKAARDAFDGATLEENEALRDLTGDEKVYRGGSLQGSTRKY